ncbi:MAG TPA: protein translocase subunit SecD [Acidimicrobiales bacterium]|nr:protein translocase subunit SecD [Acidimicrobiales bacterium]
MRRKLLVSVIGTSLACFAVLGIALGLGWSPKLGLDLEGGLQVVYAPAKTTTTSQLQTAATIMTNRANGLGVSGSSVTTQGTQIVVQIPGIKDAQQALAVLGNTAQLYFRPVLCGAPAYTPPTAKKGQKPKAVPYSEPPTCPSEFAYTTQFWQSSGPSGASGQYAPSEEYAEYPGLASYRTATPAQDSQFKNQRILLDTDQQGYAERYELGPVIATGTIIKSAYAGLLQTGGWAVEFNLTSSGSSIFNNDIAAKYYHELVANDLDGTIVSAPSIDSTNFPGSGQITGDFTQTTANNLAIDLNYGALPVVLHRLDTETVSPTLGKSSLEAGVLAGLLGLLLVMIYTILYYRALGIVVVVGLVTTAAFLFGFISMLGQSGLALRLDLSGVTGLIVSVGITVDSYVVYFERLKDEIRAGHSVRSSVDKAFKSAYRTILSADAVSLIAAVVLWLLSVGDVRGFAFMLGLSTIVDVLTSYLFTRPFVILLGQNRLVTEARWLGMARGLAAPSPAAAAGRTRPGGPGPAGAPA